LPTIACARLFSSDADFWLQKQANIKAGIYEDVFPYPKKIRFKR
jgi:isocitrate dehydrogenase kinase/phosphatase